MILSSSSCALFIILGWWMSSFNAHSKVFEDVSVLATMISYNKKITNIL